MNFTNAIIFIFSYLHLYIFLFSYFHIFLFFYIYVLDFFVWSDCEVQVSIIQGRMCVNRGVSLASTAGAATVKKIMDPFGGVVEILNAGDKGTVKLVDR